MKGHRYSKFTSVKESEIENYLVKKVEQVGGRAIKFDPRNRRGLPDRICFFPGGLLVLVELKRPGAKPRKNQRMQLRNFRRLGFQATWCDTKEKVDQIIKWVSNHQQNYKMRPVKELCTRRDCPMRIVKRN